MTDETLCIGTHCPVKEKCERYTDDKSEHHMASDFVYIEKYGCEEFILRLEHE